LNSFISLDFNEHFTANLLVPIHVTGHTNTWATLSSHGCMSHIF